ncbi:uncharacterized protein LOC105180484 [Harpegnathos saltator]|uniref:uncharacterized protein LOC105180484 n=1 Tax=Harpegnathos saltator TaxID=610380 RepID=UPI000DBEE596|nr:uncharacterized protein LOC105180484 [Harpegnathos saltator]
MNMQVIKRESIQTTFKNVIKQFSKLPNNIVNSTGVVFGIRVNAVLPGPIDTPMFAVLSGKKKEILIKQAALARIGKLQEVAEVTAF